MPIQHGYTTRDGERRGYYRWGGRGAMYTHPPGDERARERAKAMARRPGLAIMARGG